MKEHPLLFSGAMVRQLLVGAKTQTRHALQSRNSIANAVRDEKPAAFNFSTLRTAADRAWPMLGDGSPGPPFLYVKGEAVGTVRLRSRVQPQDTLWVRETWAHEFRNDGGPFFYRADHGGCQAPARWRSPIHMPRAMCRLLLVVTDVSLERLSGISEEDAIAEGCPDGRAQFFDLWKSINGAASLDADPYVWIYKFKVTHAIAPCLPA